MTAVNREQNEGATAMSKPAGDWYKSHIQRNAGEIAARLRDMADEVEREASDLAAVPSPTQTSASQIAARIAHTLQWGMANLPLSGLIATAGDYDRDILPAAEGLS